MHQRGVEWWTGCSQSGVAGPDDRLRAVSTLGPPALRTVGDLQTHAPVHSFETMMGSHTCGTPHSDAVDPLETRPPVEITVEAQNRSNAVAFHDCNVHGIAGRQQRTVLSDFPGTKDIGSFDGKHFIDNVQRDLERWSNGVPPVNSRITMENLLQDFRVSDQPLPRRNQALQQQLRLCFVWMGGSYQVHRDVGVDEDQPWYPRSISLSICSNSPVGNE